MKKVVLFIIATLISTTMLFSCQNIFGPGSDNNGGSGNNDGGTSQVGAVIWSPDLKANIVVAEETGDVTSLRQHIYQKSGIAPSVNPIYSAETSNEIVFGRTGRMISDTAYSRLDRYADLYSLEQNGNSAYLIYAEGDSIAIAYSDTFARYAAVEYLIENSSDGSFVGAGEVHRAIFNTVEFIAEKRNSQRDEGFVKVEEELGKDAADALRMVYSLYDERLYYLIANLYDPAVGGFYYSVSARDNYGYLPDIESTVQALNLIDTAKEISSPEGYQLSIQIIASAIQAEPDNAVTEAWGKSVSNGKIVVD